MALTDGTEDDKFISHVDEFFKEFIFGFIFHDIDVAVRGKANYLAALGLVAYTEFMGGLVNGSLGQKGKSKERFYTFWDRMGPGYLELKNRRDIVKIYSNVRCGLAHSYFIAQDSTVKMSIGDGSGERCGIEQQPGGRVVLIVEKYFQDFKTACERYYQELVEQRDADLLERFQKAVVGQWYLKELVAGASGHDQ